MIFLFNYKRHGLPYGLIKIHEFLINDTFSYFEKGRFVRRKIKKARKVLKSAIRFARKKKVYPSVKTTLTVNTLRDLMDEIEYTHRVIRATSAEMEKLIQKIYEEMVGDVLAVLEKARNEFRENNFQGGLDLLKDAQIRLGKEYLTDTRREILAGIDNEVKNIKKIIWEKRVKTKGKLAPSQDMSEE